MGIVFFVGAVICLLLACTFWVLAFKWTLDRYYDGLEVPSIGVTVLAAVLFTGNAMILVELM